jgi:two-component sensor histidine kinase
MDCVDSRYFGGKKAQSQLDADLKAMTLLQEVAGECTREDARLEDCLAHILATAISIAGAAKGTLQLLDFPSHSLRIIAHQGFEAPFLKFFEVVHDGAAACAAALQSGQQVIVQDVLTDEIFAGQPAQEVLLKEGVRAVISTPLRSSNGMVLGMISTHFEHPHAPSQRGLRFTKLLAQQSADYLQRNRAEKTERILNREVQHRSNNLLAVVQSLARHSLKSGAGGPEAFEARLLALARANRELVRSNWSGIELADIVQAELASFSERVTLAGPGIALEPQIAQEFTLVIHELTTNAMKYGALSNHEGTIKAAWTLEPDPRGADNGSGSLKFKWEESGGPSVIAPKRHGFGTALLNSFPEVKLDFAVGGLRCEIEASLPKIRDDFGSSPSKREGEADRVIAQRGKRPRILIVEDELLVALEVAQCFAEADFDVIGPAGSVTKALRLMQDHGCDAAVLDVNLGKETAEQVALELIARGTPFVTVSGYSAGCRPPAFANVPSLEKPVPSEVLVKEINRLLSNAFEPAVPGRKQ